MIRNSYAMSTRALPDIYTLALGPHNCKQGDSGSFGSPIKAPEHYVGPAINEQL